MTIAQAQEHLSGKGVTTPSKARARLNVTPQKRPLAPHSGRVIRSPNDLSEREKNLLVKDMIAAMDGRDNFRSHDDQPEVTNARRDEGIRFLFEDGWNTLQPIADRPHQMDMKKTLADSSICFGNFEIDHPETKARIEKAKRWNIFDKGPPTTNEWHQKDGACYIHVNQRRDKGEVTFDYKDAKGVFINPFFVRRAEGWTDSYAKARVIHHFNKTHDRHVNKWNCALFKHKGQRRLLGFAGRGEASRQDPRLNTLLEAGDYPFEKAFVVFPTLKHQIRELQQVQAHVREFGVPEKETRFH